MSAVPPGTMPVSLAEGRQRVKGYAHQVYSCHSGRQTFSLGPHSKAHHWPKLVIWTLPGRGEWVMPLELEF